MSKKHNNKVRVGLVGLGYWGKNLIRNILTSEQMQLACVCDLEVATTKDILNSHKGVEDVEIFQKFKDFVSYENVDAIIIATPPSTHYKFAKLALENNKHVLVEKPMCRTVIKAGKLNRLAKKNNLTLMCDHTYCFSGPTQAIKSIIEAGSLGNIINIHSSRLNLGLFQNNLDVLWDLAPHDLSIIQYLLNNLDVSNVNKNIVKHPVSDLTSEAHLHITLTSGIHITIHNSWISPFKERRMVIIGDKKMCVWDDLSEEKIKLYDTQVVTTNEGIGYRNEGCHNVSYERGEPLQEMINHFSECIINKKEPISSGNTATKIVQILSSLDSIPLPTTRKQLSSRKLQI